MGKPAKPLSYVLFVMGDCQGQPGGRRGQHQISMTLTPWAAHVIQWLVQWVAKPQGGANPTKTSLSSD